ncbi:hypothetical protein L3X38_035384 [Prunus dulcis]|uniref:Pectinesterase n=1 Tax=Prunus dulcis TaxID=3755 RepID=A0AAD4VJK3_PRUDU|nr:hypothetical protein L3X38_035384 [Prunus dulcis]
MQSLVASILALFFLLGALEARYNLQDDVVVSAAIIVDQNGHGNFTTVQQAIDSIPSNNSQWTRIHINHAIYVEKVVVPKEKPYIILEGDLDHYPVIEFGDGGNVVTSPTFIAHADNFIAKNIIFKNTYDRIDFMADVNGRPTTWAVAAAIDGDKQSFYQCSFLSVQDTLSDARGRHYFYECTIKGAIDFIFGSGQSLYEKCQIVSVTDVIGFPGYITANGRGGPDDPAGFVFKDCHVSGTGPINLGRAYGNHSRVLFSGTYMGNIITPQGWMAAWNTGNEDLISYSEANCSGPGADLSQRVTWEKKLSDEEVESLTNAAKFIDQDGWLAKQPK